MSAVCPTIRGNLGIFVMELEDHLFSFLDYPSAIFLAATNTYYRHRIDPKTLISDKEKKMFVKHAQDSFSKYMVEPRGHEIVPRWLGCFHCFKVLPPTLFWAEDRVFTRAIGRENELERICKNCMIEKKVTYTPTCLDYWESKASRVNV